MSRIRQRGLRKLGEALTPQPLSIFQHGDVSSKSILYQAEPIIHIHSRTNRYLFESLKLTAARAKLVSLSANQVGFDKGVFCMLRPDMISKDRWDYPELDITPQDYRIFINPRIIGATTLKKTDFEFCPSFKGKRAQVKRAFGISTSSYNEEAEFIQEKFFGFRARVFSHEVDHLRGKHLMTWSVSEGNISVCPTENEEDHYYLLNSVEHWKEQIKQAVAQFPELIEPISKKLELELDEEGNEWRKHSQQKDMEEELDLSRPRFSLEEAMESDLIKSTRKDIKRRIVTEQRRMTNSSNDTDY